MSDRYLIPLADGRWLALEAEVFSAALAEGARLASVPAPAPINKSADAPLVNAEQLALILGVDKSRVDRLRRDQLIPSVSVGRYPRFDVSAVKEALAKASDQRIAEPSIASQATDPKGKTNGLIHQRFHSGRPEGGHRGR